MNTIEAIHSRYSVRNYAKTAFSEAEKTQIIALLDNSDKGPFGNKARFIFIEKTEAVQKEKIKLGTYGFISNAAYFIAGAIEKFEYSEVDYGFLLEIIILELTRMGYGTCWIGGTLKRKDYQKLLKLKSDETIPCITPVGFAAKKKSLRERLGIKFAKSGYRHPYKSLFFENDINNPLNLSVDNPYSVALEMVRLAPSAVNKQPWRVIKVKNKFHFFISRTGLLNFNKAVDLQKVDLGIAIAHFYLTLKHLNQNGIWHIKNPEISDMEYVITWIAE